MVWNTNQHSNDYDNMKDVFRPSHADFTYTQKYGIRDHRGGGRSSARETIARVVAGALAKLALRQLGVRITAFTSQVGEFKLDKDYTAYDLSTIENNPVRCPDQELAKQMADYIYQTKGEGDTIGGVISCVIQGCPIGLGQPVFGKLHAAFAAFCPYLGKCNVNAKLFTFCLNQVKLCLGIGRECIDSNYTWKFVYILDIAYMFQKVW